MKIVKLDAIDSTNSYLRNLVKRTNVENGTVVTSEFQTKGRGLNDNKWNSEKGKNLTFSVLIKFDDFNIANQYFLNYCIAIALYNVLKYYIPNKLFVKWPNDIMSEGNKICGILTECVVKNSKVSYAIVGVGLNVNQDIFPKNINKVTSIKKRLNTAIDREELLQKILIEIQYQLIAIKKKEFVKLKDDYESVLYKKGIPSMFKDKNNTKFLGRIIGTSVKGNLLIELENEMVKEFGLKEIKFI